MPATCRGAALTAQVVPVQGGAAVSRRPGGACVPPPVVRVGASCGGVSYGARDRSRVVVVAAVVRRCRGLRCRRRGGRSSAGGAVRRGPGGGRRSSSPVLRRRPCRPHARSGPGTAGSGTARVGLREVAAVLADDLLHVVAPDLRRVRAAVDVAPAEVHAVHRDLRRAREADPHRGRQYLGVKPTNQASMFLSVVPVLPPGRAADLSACVPVPPGDVGLEDLGRLVGHAVLERLGAVDAPALRQLDLLAVALDLLDHARAVAVAAVGDRRVGVGHLQRRDAVRRGRRATRRSTPMQLGLDAHHPRRLLDLVRAEVGRELRVDRVVGGERRA